MKNRRLNAILLLAALAVLQVRIAFAGCTDGAQAGVEATALCCVEHTSQAPAGVTCIDHCVKPHALQQADTNLLAASEQAPTAHPLLFWTSLTPLSVPPQFALAEAHPAHVPLVYVLQRLLI
jgi:hypothetical protein